MGKERAVCDECGATRTSRWRLSWSAAEVAGINPAARPPQQPSGDFGLACVPCYSFYSQGIFCPWCQKSMKSSDRGDPNSPLWVACEAQLPCSERSRRAGRPCKAWVHLPCEAEHAPEALRAREYRCPFCRLEHGEALERPPEGEDALRLVSQFPSGDRVRHERQRGVKNFRVGADGSSGFIAPVGPPAREEDASGKRQGTRKSDRPVPRSRPPAPRTPPGSKRKRAGSQAASPASKKAKPRTRADPGAAGTAPSRLASESPSLMQAAKSIPREHLSELIDLRRRLEDFLRRPPQEKRVSSVAKVKFILYYVECLALAAPVIVASGLVKPVRQLLQYPGLSEAAKALAKGKVWTKALRCAPTEPQEKWLPSSAAKPPEEMAGTAAAAAPAEEPTPAEERGGSLALPEAEEIPSQQAPLEEGREPPLDALAQELPARDPNPEPVPERDQPPGN